MKSRHSRRQRSSPRRPRRRPSKTIPTRCLASGSASAWASSPPGMVARALAALEPVLWGTEPTEMAFGEARRWAVDVGGAVEVKLRDHVYGRIAADVQRFAWEWTEAGQRGAGGAIDLFPS